MYHHIFFTSILRLLYILVLINYTNLLTFWQYQSIFPHLLKVERRIIVVLYSSGIVKREFSATGQLVTQRRFNLELSTVNGILFLRSVKNHKTHVMSSHISIYFSVFFCIMLCFLSILLVTVFFM